MRRIDVLTRRLRTRRHRSMGGGGRGGRSINTLSTTDSLMRTAICPTFCRLITYRPPIDFVLDQLITSKRIWPRDPFGKIVRRIQGRGKVVGPKLRRDTGSNKPSACDVTGPFVGRFRRNGAFARYHHVIKTVATKNGVTRGAVGPRKIRRKSSLVEKSAKARNSVTAKTRTRQRTRGTRGIRKLY